MAINLVKGQKIDLRKKSGEELNNFCVGCNWGAVVKKTFFGLSSSVVDVDLDLSCLMFDAFGKPIDHIYSPLYRFSDKNIGLPNGKLQSMDGGLRHTGDDREGDQSGDDGLDNEIITVNLSQVDNKINQIVFFLNIYNNNDFQGDFSGIPYASIRMYEGTPEKVKEVFAQYDVATKSNCIGKRALIMGKLYRRDNRWRFSAIGDAYEDTSIVKTIVRVMQDYSK